jgi:hypothetical protein
MVIPSPSDEGDESADDWSDGATADAVAPDNAARVVASACAAFSDGCAGTTAADE